MVQGVIFSPVGNCFSVSNPSMKQPSDQSWRREQWAALDGGVEGVGGAQEFF